VRAPWGAGEKVAAAVHLAAVPIVNLT